MAKQNSRKIAVIGSGSWATAIVKILTNNKHELYWWVRRQEVSEYIKSYRHNPNYLSSFEISITDEQISSDINELIKRSEIVIFALPSAFLEDALEKTDKSLLKEKQIVTAIKGLVKSQNVSVSEYFRDYLNVDASKITAISGPCHAEEVASEKLSFLTFASANETEAREIADIFDCRFIKAVVSNDIEGTEYAAVLKNVYALMSGICNGIGFGDNFQAVLVSNAMKEIKAFLKAYRNIERELFDTAYLGDLLVTAYSQFSRNRTFGNMIGKGYSVKSAQMEMNMIAEGYFATKALHEIAEAQNIEMPVLEAAYNILYKSTSAKSEVINMSKNFK
jgi:glycerol-3-phosphate dehydrogenase (NAD(P)+)